MVGTIEGVVVSPTFDGWHEGLGVGKTLGDDVGSHEGILVVGNNEGLSVG